MLTKSYPKSKKKTCKVTFELPPSINAEQVAVVGEFNDWQPDSTLMKRKRDGSFSATVNLMTQREYRFRYLLDGERWENDIHADRFVANDFGSEDSVVVI